jgi:membrane-associated phospholipid phosphatase
MPSIYYSFFRFIVLFKLYLSMKCKELFLLLLFSLHSFCQINSKHQDSIVSSSGFKYKQIIIPALFVSYGIFSLNSTNLKSVDVDVKNSFKGNSKLNIDNFTLIAPTLTVFGLNAIGIEGKNTLKARSVIIGTSYLLASSLFIGAKSISSIERPDGSNNFSFPSGHTVIAFASAEFLYQEYKEVSLWYGISGYLVATVTGYLRIYNNKHWFSDVVTGAGIGILSTKIAYWIYPYLEKTIFRSNKNSYSTIISPFYNGNQAGLGLVLHLK